MASWSPVSWFRISANLGGRAFAHGKLWSPRAAWHTHVLWKMGLDLALSHPPVLFHFSAVFPYTYAALARSLYILPLCKCDILTHPESLKCYFQGQGRFSFSSSHPIVTKLERTDLLFSLSFTFSSFPLTASLPGVSEESFLLTSCCWIRLH